MTELLLIIFVFRKLLYRKKLFNWTFARLRPETILQNEVRLGNFVEIKKSKLADKVKVNHLSYLGDSTVGKNTNIGAGITCNYDGKEKYQSKIGNNCFVEQIHYCSSEYW